MDRGGFGRLIVIVPRVRGLSISIVVVASTSISTTIPMFVQFVEVGHLII